jgi:hypothetical protein
MENRCSVTLATRGLFVAVVLVAVALPGLARAELGGTVASVENDTAHLKGTVRFTATPAYTLHEIQAPTGHVVREYATTDDQVFGVSWEGPTVPDLRQLLGERYFAEFQRAAAARQRHGRGPVLVETPEFVFQQTGHLRAFQGRAYLPGLLPSGVDTSAIR